MKRKCPYCGFEVESNEIVCRNCWKKLDGTGDAGTVKSKMQFSFLNVFLYVGIVLVVLTLVFLPLILKTIRDTKISTSISYADAIVRAINDNEQLNSLGYYDSYKSIVVNGKVTNDKIEDLKNIVLVGAEFTYIDLNVKNNAVTDGCIIINDYVVYIKNGNVDTSDVKSAGGTLSCKIK